jgi:hypothetical protein
MRDRLNQYVHMIGGDRELAKPIARAIEVPKCPDDDRTAGLALLMRSSRSRDPAIVRGQRLHESCGRSDLIADELNSFPAIGGAPPEAANPRAETSRNRSRPAYANGEGWLAVFLREFHDLGTRMDPSSRTSSPQNSRITRIMKKIATPKVAPSGSDLQIASRGRREVVGATFGRAAPSGSDLQIASRGRRGVVGATLGRVALVEAISRSLHAVAGKLARNRCWAASTRRCFDRPHGTHSA